MIEALLSRLPPASIRLGLERIEAACEALGTPQARFPSLLIAGTNGKGSTAAFLHSILARTGRKIGLYTSPHLHRFHERIRIDGAAISPAALEQAGARLLEAWPKLAASGDPESLSYFEAATALAFEAFAQAEVELAILEVGLGGRLDATNVSGSWRLASVITPISMDHMDYLGGDLVRIAEEKAAIARAGVPLITAPQPPEVMEVLRRRAKEVGAELVVAPADPADSPLLSRAGGDELRLGLLGRHQLGNAALALATLEAIEGAVELDEAMVREGLEGARWPGRLEVVGEAPLTILDGAHNAAGAAALAAALVELWPGRRFQILFGVLADKDRSAILEALAPLAAAFHFCPVESGRAVPASTLAQEAEILGVPHHSYESLDAALEGARKMAREQGALLVCGTLYLVGAARDRIVGATP